MRECLLVCTLIGVVACGSDGDNPSSDGGEQVGDVDGAMVGDGDSGVVSYRHLCDLEPPPGAERPPPLPAYSGGTCPEIVAGRNTLTSSGSDRELIVVVPEEIEAGEKLPVGVLWHPLGSEADVFLRKGELQRAIDNERFIAVLPEAKGDLQLQWPWSGLDPQFRVDEELVFFDDMLTCVAEQFDVNVDCISNGGVSSGGLWATQVGWERGEYIASLLSVSGGSGTGSVVKEWQGSPHKMPAMVLWGGSADTCIVFNFTDTSHTLEQELAGDGHFVLECIHNCGHAIPPFQPPEGESEFAPLWEFVLNHPYWLGDGDSPYLDALPANVPEWCAIGVGNATPRTGTCDEPSQC